MVRRKDCNGPEVAWNGDLSVVDCASCGYAHLARYPGQEETSTYYESDQFYRKHAPGGWLQKEAREHKKGLWRSAYDYQISLLSKRETRLLDVGGGGGWFAAHWLLHQGKTGDLNTVRVVEPSNLARLRSPLPRALFYRRIEDASDIYGHVRASLVLEHLPDPDQVIQSLIPKLSEHGNLMIVVPNEQNPLQLRLWDRREPAWWVSKVHVNYFTPHSLRRVLERNGLQVVYEGVTFPMEVFLLAGLDYRKHPGLGKRLHRTRLQVERLLGHRVFRLYDAMYRRWGIGRELVFVTCKTKQNKRNT